MKKTKHFPFPPDKKTIKVEDFSPYMMEYRTRNYKPSEKLIVDQTNKQRFFIPYRDLKFYIRHGIRVVNIFTVFRYKQSWLAKYIKIQKRE